MCPRYDTKLHLVVRLQFWSSSGWKVKYAFITITPRGARGVVVIAVGNERGDTSSNPGRD